jgi:peptide/nickel transport system substrate-binding protein
MKRFARTSTKMALVTIAGAMALAACGGSSGSSNGSTGSGAPSGFAGIPAPTGSPTSGGTVAMGMSAGATPTWIFPITPGANGSVYTANFFQELMWRPMWWTPVSDKLDVNYALSLAPKPVFSNGDKTVTIKMNTNYKWSNGAPVDANDVIFDIDLLKAAVAINASNVGAFSPGFFPQNVASATATGKYTVVLHLTKAYNPGYFFLDQLNLITPLPSTAWNIDKAGGPPVSYTSLANAKKIYAFLAAQSGKLSTYATNPLWQDVDGPWKLTAFSPSTDANTMVPNQAYTGPNKPHIAKFQEVAFTSDEAEYTALRSGTLTVGLIPSDDLPQVPTLKKNGYNVFGEAAFGWDYAPFNFKDTTGDWNKIIGQLYVRQALQHLVDSDGIIKGIYHGYAAPAFGPVPSLPASPFTPANGKKATYPFSVTQAKSLLAAHGWKSVGGVQTCESAGTAGTDCGAGIKKGDTLAFTMVYATGNPATLSLVTAYASAAKSAGIPVKLTGKSFNFIISNYDNPAAPSNVNKWQAEDFGGFTQDLYPTTNTVLNTSGSYNIGSYSSPTADSLINKSVFGSDPSAVNNEASYLGSNLPALWQPESDHVFAWSTKLQGPQASFWELPQFSLNPEQWYLAK